MLISIILRCGAPKAATLMPSYSVTGEQALAFDRLFDVVLGFLRSGKTLKVAPGCGIAHAIDILRCISIDDRDTNSNHKTWEAIAASSVALPISVSDVEKTTPTQAGNIRPEDHLLHGRGNQFLDIQSRILDPPPLASAIPKSCYLDSQDDEPHLRRFLLTRGLVRLIDVSDVSYDTAGHPIVGGLFGVWHRIANV